ncbi:MAG: hypothetical protein U0Q55_16980 [Vicinamibacterales bacterium]
MIPDDDSAPPPEARLTRTCHLWVDDLLHARFLDAADVSAADARENLAVAQGLTGGVARPAVIDLRPIRSQAPEARSLFAGAEASTVANAVALVVASPLSRVLGSFYLGFNKPLVPTRLFTSLHEATAWLRSVRT